MFSYFRNVLKITQDPKKPKYQSTLMTLVFRGALEDVLFWESKWLTIPFILLLNLVFLVCVYKQINLLVLIFALSTAIVIMDAFEAWLKYKHRTSFLKRLAYHDGERLNNILKYIKSWMHRKITDYIFLRKTNPTKAFLVINIILFGLFIIGNYISGYMITYILCMFICFSKQIVPPIIETLKKLQQHSDSDAELEGLIPEISDVDLKLLSIEPENQVSDEKQSLDYWKPEDVPIEEGSDSSESSSIVTNLSASKHTLERDEDSDSSEDDYIPHDNTKEQLRSTMEVIHTDNSWSGAAYNTLWNITGAVTSLVQNSKPEENRKSISSLDSSDGFEFIDKRDLT